jgi:hypothetical protein
MSGAGACRACDFSSPATIKAAGKANAPAANPAKLATPHLSIRRFDRRARMAPKAIVAEKTTRIVRQSAFSIMPPQIACSSERLVVGSIQGRRRSCWVKLGAMSPSPTRPVFSHSSRTRTADSQEPPRGLSDGDKPRHTDQAALPSVAVAAAARRSTLPSGPRGTASTAHSRSGAL